MSPWDTVGMGTVGAVRAIAPVLAATLLGGVPSVVHAEPAVPDVLDCTTIPKSADEATLVKRFGRAAVKSVGLAGAEGQIEQGTALDPGDPRRRLNVFWSDVAHRRRPSSVVIRDASRWRVRLRDGATLSLGAGLLDVEAANGRPFAVSGFYWDYGGFATDWNGGTLPTLPGGCRLSVRFDPDPKAAAPATRRVSGEKTFASSSPVLKAVSPTVSVLSLDWPD